MNTKANKKSKDFKIQLIENRKKYKDGAIEFKRKHTINKVRTLK